MPNLVKTIWRVAKHQVKAFSEHTQPLLRRIPLLAQPMVCKDCIEVTFYGTSEEVQTFIDHMQG